MYEPYYDVNTMFQAKALILGETREALTEYLDVPAYDRGDLFYIQNLVAAIEAPSAAPTINKSVPLVTGWNLVALPLTPTSATPSILFAPIAGQLDSVLAYDGCDTADPWKKSDPKAPSFTNDLTEVGMGRGLWIRTTANTTLTVTGSAPSSVSIALSAGPNLISYPSSASVSLPDSLASITASSIKSSPTMQRIRQIPGKPLTRVFHRSPTICRAWGPQGLLDRHEGAQHSPIQSLASSIASKVNADPRESDKCTAFL